MGRSFFQKENTHLGGVIMFTTSVGIIDKSFMSASLNFFLYAFNIFLFGGWCQRGRSLGTKAMKIVSNTKHHQIKKIHPSSGFGSLV
jgi:hypothetical protein